MILLQLFSCSTFTPSCSSSRPPAVSLLALSYLSAAAYFQAASLPATPSSFLAAPPLPAGHLLNVTVSLTEIHSMLTVGIWDAEKQ
jgi:hypothetical protein